MSDLILEELKSRAEGYPEKARAIAIRDDVTLTDANGFLLGVKKMRALISETFEPIITKAHQAHKEAIEQKKRYEQPLIEAEGIVKREIATYMAEQEKIQKEVEEKARREEEERRRLEEEKMKAALEAENAGKAEEAEKILNEVVAEPEPKPVVVPQKPKLQGVRIRKIWKWRVVNSKLIPRGLLIVNTAMITEMVKSTKGQIQIPGIEIYTEDSVAARTEKGMK